LEFTGYLDRRYSWLVSRVLRKGNEFIKEEKGEKTEMKTIKQRRKKQRK
jgi:hypothetical protein